MHIEYFKSLMDKHEDVILHFKKRPPIAVTHNFETPYIKERIKGVPEIKQDKFPVWSWTTNKVLFIDTNEVKFVEPLHVILGNK
jgi:hypothetical protein